MFNPLRCVVQERYMSCLFPLDYIKLIGYYEIILFNDPY
jgi:hypothetical protein